MDTKNVTLLKFTNRKRDRVCTKTLQEKWKLFFRFLDINNDGVINAQDFVTISSNVNKVYMENKKSAQRVFNLSKALTSWWQVFKRYFGGTREVSTESEFITALKDFFESNIIAFESHADEMSNSMFEVLDLDGDGLVSRKEYIKLFSAMGVRSNSYLGRVFDRLDSTKVGVLRKEDFNKAFTDFFVGDSLTNPMTFLFKFPQL